ncbi:MAG: hypothetical protein KIS68_12640 [Bauldia sp.]|nr:hypothetical protein [Bauldia sp.]
MAFKLRPNLRLIPAPTLKRYFASHGLEVPEATWATKKVGPLADRLADHVLQASSVDALLAGLVRAAALASTKGQTALISSAPDRAALTETFAKFENVQERSLWFLMEHPAAFEIAEMRHFLDHHAERQFARHNTAPPGIAVARERSNVGAFEADVAGHFRRTEGSGLSCRAEFVDREEDGSIQLTLHIQGLPASQIEVIGGNYSRRIAHPTIEAAVSYRLADGHLTTIIRGGAPAHEVLCNSFRANILATTAELAPIKARPFALDGLIQRRAFVPEVTAGLEAVRLRALRLVERNGGGVLTIEAPAGKPDVSVYDLATSWFTEGTRVLKKFYVRGATLTFHFLPPAGKAKGRALNVELGWPNSSNLKQLDPEERRIVEDHIARFGLSQIAA